MLFRLIVAVASVSFISQGAIAQVTDGQLVTDLGVVASVSSNALAVLDPISTSSSKSDVQSAAQAVDTSITSITNDLTSYTSAMGATSPFPVTDCTAAQDIITAQEKFVGISISFLSLLVEDHQIFAQFLLAVDLSGEFVTPLEDLKAAFDLFAAALTNLLSNCNYAATLNQLQEDFDGSVSDAISTYQQICTPSLLYPSVLPECISLP
ncbi:hypothetical protein V8E53_013192 [Lactarius tabidus]